MSGARGSEVVGRLRLVNFALPTLPLAALGLPLAVYLPEYYANHLGLNLSMVGAAFMLVRILDLIFDPIMGGIMDRSRSRFGRFRPWMVIVAPILVVSTYMLFMAKPGIGPLYLWVWLAFTYCSYSVAVLAHMSWAAGLTADYQQRSRVYTFWQSGNVLGMILVLILPPLAATLEGASYATSVQAMGWFIVALLPITIGLAAFLVGEKVPDPKRQHTERGLSGLRVYLGLMRSDSVRRIMIADLALSLAPGIAGALFFFFFEQIKGLDKAQAGLLLLCYFVGGLIGAPLWNRLSAKIGKHRALITAAVFYTVAQTGVMFMPSGNFPLLLVGIVFAGLPYSAAGILLRSMLADVSDEERLNSGRDRTGLLYALLMGTGKAGTALAVGITFVGLDLLGFKAAGNAQNTPEALLGLQLLYVALPGLLGLLAAATFLGYQLDAPRHAQIRTALALRDAAAAQEGLANDPEQPAV